MVDSAPPPPVRPDPALRRMALRRIALVGVDGSGKTTQAHRLADELTRLGVPAAYRRWRGRLARRLGRPGAAELLGRRGLLFAESVLRWLAIAWALVRSGPRRPVAVMDRYAVCQYASIRAHGRHPGRGSAGERLARLAYRIFPDPDVTFLLAVSPAEAYRRIEQRGTDHETLDYLSLSAAAYRRLPESDDFVVVDADRPPEQVAAAILAELGDRLPSGPQPTPCAPPALTAQARP